MSNQSVPDGPETLARLWEEHTRHEFQTQSTADTIATMVEDAYVDHVLVLTGGSGSRVDGILLDTFRPKNAARHADRPGFADDRTGSTCRGTRPQIHAQHRNGLECQESSQLIGPWRLLWWLPSASGTARSRMSISTGIKPRCSSRSACSIPKGFQ